MHTSAHVRVFAILPILWCCFTYVLLQDGLAPFHAAKNVPGYHVEGEAHIFIKEIFEKYGKDGAMTFEGFEHLLENLGLGNIEIGHGEEVHVKNGGFREFHKNHTHAHLEENHYQETSGHTEDNARVKRWSTLPGKPQTTGATASPEKESETTTKKARRHRKKNRRNRNRNNKDVATVAPTVPASRQRRDLSSNLLRKRVFELLNRMKRDATSDGRTGVGPATSSDKLMKCMTPSTLLEVFQVQDMHNITEVEFISVCPSIVYQLDNKVCRGTITGEIHGHHDVHNKSGNGTGPLKKALAEKDRTAEIWGFASCAVIIISLVGLLGVAVVPVMQRMFYNHLLQFLVALAVGSLTGDALLHLLPHALGAHSKSSEEGEGHSHEGEPGHKEIDPDAAVWKGIIALVGIYFFFLMERAMGIYSSYKARQTKERKDKAEGKEPSKGHGHSHSPGRDKKVGQRLSISNDQRMGKSCEDILMMVHPNNKAPVTSQWESVPLSLGGMALRVSCHDTMAELADAERQQKEAMRMKDLHASLEDVFEEEEEENDDTQEDTPALPQVVVRKSSSVPNIVISQSGEFTDEEDHHSKAESCSEIHDDHEIVPKNEEKKKANGGHGHSHGAKRQHSHGHSHGGDGPLTSTVSAVAWMVIMGDGLHNFSDGLAIGAAFANSLTGGLSTSIAVFCHELPHELGDFAMLLRAGMSVKQAMVYNGVSSVLCFGGMLIGIALGNIGSASLYIFALTGGMFVYIALVDMLPELAAVETGHHESMFFHLILQSCGMILGIGIMCTIAIYEDQIKVG